MYTVFLIFAVNFANMISMYFCCNRVTIKQG